MTTRYAILAALLGLCIAACEPAQSLDNWWSPYGCEGQWIPLADAEHHGLAEPLRGFLDQTIQTDGVVLSLRPDVEGPGMELPDVQLSLTGLDWDHAEIFVPDDKTGECWDVVDVTVPLTYGLSWSWFEEDYVERTTLLHSLGRGAVRHVGFALSVREMLSGDGRKMVSEALEGHREGFILLPEEQVSFSVTMADEWFDPTVDSAYSIGFGMSVMAVNPAGYDSMVSLISGSAQLITSK